MVAVSVKEPRLALSQIRGLALRTRKAAQSVGAVWRDIGRSRPAQVRQHSSRGFRHGDRIPLPI